MIKNAGIKKLWIILGLGLLLTLSSKDAFAWGRGRPHGTVVVRPRREVVVVRGRRYDYDGDRFYRRGFFGFSVIVPPFGAVVRVLPSGYRAMIFGGNRYYYYNNAYYRDCPSGYIVVPGPFVSSQEIISGDTVTINIPNSNGSYTSVKLVKRGNGYVGPQGEYYPAHPTVEQLRALYGN